ncbi:MAG: DUF6701 domain-containing protein [Dehalococcoidales bacterium]
MSTSSRTKYLSALLMLAAATAFAVTDSYLEDFSGRNPGVTINGQDDWAVTQGGDNNAIVDDQTTPDGTGRSLRITDASPTVSAGRPADYGGVSPTWVSYDVMAASGNKQRGVPATGIAAVTFDYTGKILASSGSGWVDSGLTYETGQWYTVTLKLDFSAHSYDLYISPYNTPNVQFVPVKSGLQFIDTSTNKLSKYNFHGAYSSSGRADSYVDDISISYIYRLEFINTPQVIVQNEVSGPITVQLQDADSAPQTALDDYTLELKSTSSGGKFSLRKDPWVNVTQVVISKFSQGVTFYYKDSAVGRPLISAAEYPEIGWEDALQQQRIMQRLAHFTVASTTPQAAGEDFKLTITAKDEDGNVNLDYSGTVVLEADYISPPNGTKQLSRQEASGFSRGVLEPVLSYPDAGVIAITVKDKDDPELSGTSGSVEFVPSYFSINAKGPQAAGRSFDISVEAKNLSGQLTPNYKGDMRLLPVFVDPVSADGASFLPAAISGEVFLSGKAALPVSYNRWGTVKIRAEDRKYPGKYVESANIKFNAAGLKVTVPEPPSGRGYFYIGEIIQAEIDVNDAAGSPIPNFTGPVSIMASSNLDLSASYDFVPRDQGKHILPVSAKATGKYTIRAREAQGGLSAESSQFEVRNATIVVIDTTSPIGTAEVLIQLVDDQGRVITSENNLEILITLIEGLDNLSASSMSTVTPVRFINGQIRIPVSDTEAEEVGIIPQTELGLKIKAGKVTFGRIAKSGIGTLMWREIKEKKEKK